MDVYLEIGKKRTFAGALDWPGWCRSGKDETSALQALLDYAPRYARAIETARLEFTPPADVSVFRVLERLEGGAGTDFGAPGMAPSADTRPVDQGELQRFQSLFVALWQSFDATVRAAGGKELRKGPRGGGRDLEGIVRHVLEAEMAYLTQLGGKPERGEKGSDPRQFIAANRQAILVAIGAAARGELPQVGPRGGKRWTPRFFARYAAWHLLDHTWEIEDRILNSPLLD